MSNAMFCYQCQETVGNKGCTQIGVCGEKPETAALQDVLVYVTKGLAQVATKLRSLEQDREPRERPHGCGQPLQHHHQCQL